MVEAWIVDEADRSAAVKVRRNCFPISEDAISACATPTGEESGGYEEKERGEKSLWRVGFACLCAYLNIQRCVYNRSTCSRVKVTSLDNSPDTFPADPSVECSGRNDDQQLSNSNDVDQIARSEIDVKHITLQSFGSRQTSIPGERQHADPAKRSV